MKASCHRARRTRHLFGPLNHKGATAVVHKGHIRQPKTFRPNGIDFVPGATNRIKAFILVL